MTNKVKKRIGSFKQELIRKSREAAWAAVQTFNNPNITFKSEIYVVLMHIAWTYLLHAYYRSKGIDYRYSELKNLRRKFDRTRKGAFKYWELERCLNDKDSPIDKDTANNLRFLIGLRHEIEHQMTTRIDDLLSARFQAACLNYNDYIKILFGTKNAIDKHLSFSLQFSSLSEEQVQSIRESTSLPSHISKYIKGFDEALTEEEFNNPRFAYRILFVPKTANHKGQADRVIEFVKSDSSLASQVNAQYVVIKETERPKFRAGQIVKRLKDEGFNNFKMHHHTQLWKENDGKNPGKGFGVDIARTWFWYERWVDVVVNYCRENAGQYS